MERKLEICSTVVFIDGHRQEQDALVNCIHGDPEGRVWQSSNNPEDAADGEWVEPGSDWPCINLVIVSPNEDCQDQYGRQLERHTSVVHQSHSSAVGYCYRFRDEKLLARHRQPTVS